MKKKPEMVTIEIPLDVAEAFASLLHMLGCGDVAADVTDACKAALVARKSGYERWRESLGLPWQVKHGDPVNVRGNPLPWNTHPDSVLIAAAPQLLESLIAEHNWGKPGTGSAYTVTADTKKAIRAALPEAVANEVLGE